MQQPSLLRRAIRRLPWSWRHGVNRARAFVVRQPLALRNGVADSIPAAWRYHIREALAFITDRSVPVPPDHGPGPLALFVDAHVPTPQADSGSLDQVNLIRILTRLGWRVWFVPSAALHAFPHWETEQGLPHLEAAGGRLLGWPNVRFTSRAIRLAAAEQARLVVLTRAPIAAGLVRPVRQLMPGAKLVFDTVDLHFLRLEREAALTGRAVTARQARRYRRIELELVRAADATLVRSPVEAETLKALVPQARVTLMPLIRDFGDLSAAAGPPGPERQGAVFLGSYKHPPNLDAVDWLKAAIWPAVRRQAPDAVLTLAGAAAPPELTGDPAHGIALVGFVEDLALLFAKARVAVAPLRYGAGQKGKVVSSLAAGVPTVVTSVAAEGMGLEDGVQVLVADDADSFAGAVLRLLRDDALWSRLAAAGPAFVTERFGLPAAQARVEALLAELGLAGDAIAAP